LNGGFFDKQSEVGGLNLAQMLESWNWDKSKFLADWLNSSKSEIRLVSIFSFYN
jgi:hypothetical protein